MAISELKPHPSQTSRAEYALLNLRFPRYWRAQETLQLMSATDEQKLRMDQQSMVDVNLQEKSEFREKLELLTAAASQGEGTDNN